MKVRCELNVNGEPVVVYVAPTARLVDLLRDELGLLGTKEGCGNGECGACTVIVDGRSLCSCLYPALEAGGRSVTTVEGLGGPRGALSVVQRAFVEEGSVQCGFCTPGMIMSATDLLEREVDPSEARIVEALTGNLCRCTGYKQIVGSIRSAAAELARAELPRDGQQTGVEKSDA